MMAVVKRYTAARDLLQLIMGRAALNDQGRIQLFQHIPVSLEQHQEELQDVCVTRSISIPLRTPSTWIVSFLGNNPIASSGGRM